MSRLVAVADFVPAPGALYELPLATDDLVEPVPSDSKVPAGWVLVQHVSGGLRGIVPESFLQPAGFHAFGAETPAPKAVAAQDRGGGAASGDSGAGVGIVAGAKQTSPKPGSASSSRRASTEVNPKNRRLAAASFKPEAGVVYELNVNKDDELEVVTVGWDVPDGWVVAKHAGSEAMGLVPEACLVPWPAEADEPSLQEQKEEAEKALNKALADNASMTQQLEEKATLLVQESTKASSAEVAREEAQSRLESANADKTQLSSQLEELEKEQAKQAAMVNVVEQMPKVMATMVKTMAQAPSDGESSEQVAQKVKDDTLTSDEADQHRKEMEEAEKARKAAAEKIQELDRERKQQESQLKEAESKLKAAAQQLSAKDEEAARAERILHLLPRVKELFTPTQDELMAYMEVMTTSIMKHAEESASLFLETMAQSGDPQEAIREAYKRRALRASQSNGALGQSHRTAPTPPVQGMRGLLGNKKGASSPWLAAHAVGQVKRKPPQLPTEGSGRTTPPTRGLVRPASAGALQPSSGLVRPASAGALHPSRSAHKRPASGKAIATHWQQVTARIDAGQKKASMPDRMRQTVSSAGPNADATTLDELAQSPLMPQITTMRGAVSRALLMRRGNKAHDAHAQRLAKAREVAQLKREKQAAAFRR